MKDMEETIQQLFEKVKKETLLQLSKRTSQLDHKVLASSNIASKLHDEFKIDAPVLLEGKTEVTIGKGKATIYDRPKGFSPGQTVDFALFTVPIEGSYDLFVRILKNYPWGSNFFHSDGKVFFKEISTAGIIGGHVVEKLRLKAEDKFDNIRQILKGFQLDAKDFNENELKRKIEKAISDEIDKRILKKEILLQMSKKVAQLDDKALKPDNFEKTKTRLFDEFKIDTPVLQTGKMKVRIDKGKGAVNNLPKGGSYFIQREKGNDVIENQEIIFKNQFFSFPFSNKPSKGFSPGQTVHFALFTVLIEGSYELFTRIFRDHSWNENFHHSDGRVFFKEILPVEIIGNSQVVEKIRKKVEAKFSEITELLDNFNKLVVKFNNDLLDPENQDGIPKKIEKEQEKRKLKRGAETQLNPFLRQSREE